MKALSLALALMMLALGACLQFDRCDPEERAAFDAIEHFGDTPVAEDHPYGTCAAQFTADDPDTVIDHYLSALPAAGYVVSSPETFPITDESDATVGRTISLAAEGALMNVTVSSEVFDGAEPAFVIHVSRRPDEP